MSTKGYELEAILYSLMKKKEHNVKKRVIYDKSYLGGIGSKWIIVGFLLLPVLIYFAIFNPISFAYFGIAQAVVVYIVTLVFAMQIIFVLSYFNNKSVLKMVMSSWQHYFPDIDIKLVLSSGMTPYRDFLKHYAKALNEGLEGERLHARLTEAFAQMREENKELIEAISKDKTNQIHSPEEER